MIDQMVKLLRGQILGLHHEPRDTRIQVTRPGAHRQTAGRCKSHAGVDAAAIANGGQTRPIAKVG